MDNKNSCDKNLKSPDIAALLNRACELFQETKIEKSLEIYKTILSQIGDNYPDDRHAMYKNIANCYYRLKDFESAIAAYENALKISDKDKSFYAYLGYMYYDKDFDKCNEYYLKSMENSPSLKNFVMLTQSMIKCKNYSQSDLKNTFEKYVDYFRPKILDKDKPYNHSHLKEKRAKKLKIGYLSSDFHCHAMMHFILPIIENHNQNKFDITLYSCGKKEDATTARLKETGIKFVDCKEKNNRELACLINSDEIDILVDISGYTHDAVWALLYKPAPVQVQYLGFLGTYGMKEVDYIIADKYTIPRKTAPKYTEKPMYIECGMNRFVLNGKKQTLPDVTFLPYLKNNYITFGSFNSMSKLNPYTISLWADVLKAVENSKLLIYRTQMAEKDILRFKKQFKEHEVDENRLIFKTDPVGNSYFCVYSLCDVALDPSPFSGLTITIEQLNMGVPTLTLPGETISSRGAARVNRALGLKEFIAKDEKDYVKKAVKIAKHPEKLEQYRKTLREKLQNSILCTGYKHYTECIEREYQKAWANFCKKNRRIG